MSYANSSKQHQRQTVPEAAGMRATRASRGLMIESHLEEGR
jgi:3-deoxy-D-arabino-heptulosonate 7-phosphate (DAHP) synthase